MTKVIKIIVTIIFFMFWGQLQSGCLRGARSTGSGLGYAIMNILGLVSLFAGTYGIWKYVPESKKNNDDQQLDKS
jgi:hypothetical protein